MQKKNNTKILIVFHSMYGHIFEMAKNVAKGAEKIDDVEVKLVKVKETLSEEILTKMGASDFQEALDEIPEVKISDLEESDAIIFGTPTRFGNMSAQMRTFLDSTGGLWGNGSLIGKVGSVFVSSATQHGGQESTILSFHTTLLHHGMVIVGLPYSFAGQMRTDEMTGGSPYGSSTIAGGDGSRTPSENELEAAAFQGEHVAKIAKKLNN